MNFQQAGFERAAQEYEQASRDQVHVAVAQATGVSGAEMLERMGALEHHAEQTWTSHQGTLLITMNKVAKDALDNQRRSLLNEATTELQSHQMQSHEHLQEYQRRVRRHLSEVQKKVQVQQVGSREEIENCRHELS